MWESNDERIQARAMEFSNTPHHGTMKTLIRAPHLWDVPAYEWLNALSTVRKRFIVFLHPVSSEYRGTADIRVTPDTLEIIERGAGGRRHLACSRYPQGRAASIRKPAGISRR